MVVETAGEFALGALDLPGGIVIQKHYAPHGDCFSACVSMLTGVDLDLLPVSPPPVYISEEAGWTHVVPDIGAFSPWQALLEDNGFALEDYESDSTGFFIACLYNMHLGIAHAVIGAPNSILVDPAGGVVDTFEQYAKNGWVEFKRLVVRSL